MANDDAWRARLNAASEGKFPGWLGIDVLHVETGLIRGRLEIRDQIVARTGYLAAPIVVGLADTLCAYGVRLPEGAVGFTTSELKCNFMGTVRGGAILCEGKLLHGGRTTQVWDALITEEGSGKLLAAFRCTQIVLWPRQP